MRDKNLGNRPMFKAICAECGNVCEMPFEPTGERPIYCNTCFKNKRGDSHQREERRKQGFEAVCDKCGNRCEVPFRPTSGKPVFCKNCFKKGDSPSHQGGGEMKAQMASINSKLERILKILSPAVIEPKVEKKEGKEASVATPKKAAKKKTAKKKK